MEDSAVNGSNLTVTRYGLGARGIDYEEVATGTYTNSSTRSVGSFSNVGFPIYDAHGNMVATLARSGSNYFQLNNKRSFDAWGGIRNGAQTGDPKNRYCGSLGHQHDDESGLIYMRARYYEPGSGRFVSEDPEGDGTNSYIYCRNSPTVYFDRTGHESIAQCFWLGLVAAFMKELLQNEIIWAFGKTKFSVSKIFFIAIRTLVECGLMACFIGGISEENKALSAEALDNKLGGFVVGGATTGLALGAITAYEEGRHMAPIVFEIFSMDVDASK